MEARLDAVFVLKAKERLLARAAALRDTDQAKQASAKGRALIEAYRRGLR